jgi:hypothetical protein
MAFINHKKTHFSPMTSSLRKYHFFVWIVIASILLVAIGAAYFGSLAINQ